MIYVDSHVGASFHSIADVIRGLTTCERWLIKARRTDLLAMARS